MTPRRAAAVTASSRALGVWPLAGQEPPEPEHVLELAVETRLVRIDVIVTDENGQPAAGLIRDDFEVLEDGEPQRITPFEALLRGRPVAGPAPDRDDPAPEGPAPEGYRRRYIVLAVDDLTSCRRSRGSGRRTASTTSSRS